MIAGAAFAITVGRTAAGERCVFKQLRPDDAQREDLVVRLRNERAVLASLDGVPGVLRLLDASGDPPVLTLEYADGGSLADRLERGRPAPEEARRTARDLLAALTGCHARGVIHRDVKPSNILFVGGELRLADFGLAAWGDPPRALPPGWEEDDIGTPPWSAPELRHHAANRTTMAADVYGAAMVLLAIGIPRSAALDAALDDDPALRPTLGELERSLG
ncbi:MAG: protein kinase domain-containing protein [Gemmatimonadales bacterium]